ncbi:hypothetical protein NQ318_002262 [Aromia moschata]|uniref:Transmembrane protein n=1 Tax=Aromia moschata TaxID=1265417 RepID=A0AAV8Z311_9CUCU|nr:hypothetical protein NQ318_002262 [Aromia moschata]
MLKQGSLYFRNSMTVDDTVDKFHKSRDTCSRPPAPTGRTPIYNFDEWSRTHYGATFQRTMETRNKQRRYQTKREQEVNDVKMEKLLFIFGALFLMCMYAFQTNRNTYDNVYVGSSSMSFVVKKDKNNSGND